MCAWTDVPSHYCAYPLIRRCKTSPDRQKHHAYMLHNAKGGCLQANQSTGIPLVERSKPMADVGDRSAETAPSEHA